MAKHVLLLATLVAALIFSLPYNTACAQGPSSAAPPLVVGFVAGSGGFGDESFNDMALEGLRTAQKRHGIRIELESPDPNTIARKHALNRLLSRNATFIIANGFEYKDVIEEYALANPNIRFLLNDYPLKDLPNVAYTVFAQHEGSYLVGALAAKMTKTKKVGVIGGTDFEVIKSFIKGYIRGVRHTDPDVVVATEYVSPGLDPRGFSKPERAYRIARRMYRTGVDIIYAVAGLSGNGVIQAAKDNEAYAIGVDADQDKLAKGYVLTSMMKRLDLATLDQIEHALSGQFKAGPSVYGLREGGVSLTEMRYTRDQIPKSTLEYLETTKQRILTGQIRIPNPLY